eukprot:GHVL01003213.1.p1 GENE.GHVL01003213.1~~GHVL01003213.1.p1  ORF type:complete len:285 (-),score=34.34 GHVL01003213.1:123-977(-)
MVYVNKFFASFFTVWRRLQTRYTDLRNVIKVHPVYWDILKKKITDDEWERIRVYIRNKLDQEFTIEGVKEISGDILSDDKFWSIVKHHLTDTDIKKILLINHRWEALRSGIKRHLNWDLWKWKIMKQKEDITIEDLQKIESAFLSNEECWRIVKDHLTKENIEDILQISEWGFFITSFQNGRSPKTTVETLKEMYKNPIKFLKKAIAEPDSLKKMRTDAQHDIDNLKGINSARLALYLLQETIRECDEFEIFVKSFRRLATDDIEVEMERSPFDYGNYPIFYEE